MRSRYQRHLSALLRPSPAPAGAGLLAVFAAAIRAPRKEPQLPPEFTWPDYLALLLTVAAQIEHSLMVQYLYAAYSMGGPDVPPDRQETVTAWQQTILGIAKEEMGHLITVQNVLKLIGAPLALDREDYPWDSEFVPYSFTLERLTRGSLAKYVLAESPEDWPPDVPVEEREQIVREAEAAGACRVNRVGALYEAIIGIVQDPAKLPDELFRAETYPFQASWDEWGRGYRRGQRGNSIARKGEAPEVIVRPLASRDDAVSALQAVAEQGEAATSAAAGTEKSHFLRFLEIWRDFPDGSVWSATVPVPPNVSAPGPGMDPDATPIEHPEAVLWAQLFNLRYRMLLTYLGHAFELSDDLAEAGSPSRRGMVINRLFGEMYNLRAIAGLLTRLPLAEGSEQRAAPPFQMPYTLRFPTMVVDFWRLHVELLRASEGLIQQFDRMPATGHGPAYLVALASADRRTRDEIEAVVGALSGRAGARPVARRVG